MNSEYQSADMMLSTLHILMIHIESVGKCMFKENLKENYCLEMINLEIDFSCRDRTIVGLKEWFISPKSGMSMMVFQIQTRSSSRVV